MRRLMWLMPALLLTLCMARVQAGEIAPELQNNWSQIGGTDKVVALFHLWERVDLREMDITLREMRVTRQQRHQIVVEELQRVARESQPPFLAALDEQRAAGTIEGYTAYWITNCVCVKGDRATLEALASHPSIQWVEADPVMELIDPVQMQRAPRETLDDRTPGVNAVRAPEVWYDLGFTGDGTLIGGMDTGVDVNHPALNARWRGNEHPVSECWLNVIGAPGANPSDQNSHGTHTMGTMCGTGSASSLFDTIGVAPGAQWIACNAIGAFGNDFNSDVLQGYQWFADPDNNPETVDDVPDVVQNSWGVSGMFSGYTDCFEFWNESIIAMETAGTVVTFSAGNEGPGPSSHRSPANVAIDSVTFFSVGAVNANGFPNTPYPVVDFSSRGPSDCDPAQFKPEIVAPGDNVYSCIPGGGYTQMSGTSMAGPHIAGVVALMRSANPNADVREIKSVLLETAIDYNTVGDDNTSGRGMVDAYEAVMLIASDRGWVFGQVTNVNNGSPISGARVQAGDNYVRMTDSQGNYRISLPADSLLPFTVSAFGYAQYVTTMQVADSDTIVVDIEMTPVASGTINATVLMGNDVPVEHVVVTPQNIPVGPVETDDEGHFSYTLPELNTYTFHLTFQDIAIDTSIFIPAGGTVNAVIRLESARTAPITSDSSAYMAFDRYDDVMPAPYVWTDMTDATELTFPPIADASVFMEMPFPFKYFGQTYDSITVNENAWIAGGEDPDRRNANTAIPHPLGPSAMVALFWDNLILSINPVDSRVWWKHDQANGELVIEYEMLCFAPCAENYLTAQLHIYDQESWPTPTGDCELLFVYEQVDVANSATAGIESPSETHGIQIVNNTVRNPHAFAIEPGAAILFTTRTGPRTTGNLSGTITLHPALSQAVPNGVRLGTSTAQVFVDGSYSFQNVFTGPRTLRLQLPNYERAVGYATVNTGQTTDLDLEAWRLDPPSNLTFTRTNDSLFLAWEPPTSVGGLDEFQSYNVYLDSFLLGGTTAQEFRTRIPTGDLGHAYWLTATYDGGESGATDTIRVSWIDADDVVAIPTVYAMSPAYPNPFNPTTTLNVSLPQSARLTLRVFDVTGREVALVTNGLYAAGVHRFTWNAEGNATGVYFARLESELGTQIQKLLLLK